MSNLRKTKIDGERFHATVLMITERDERGRPLVARFVHDEQKVDLRELKQPEFIIIYANRETWGGADKGS